MQKWYRVIGKGGRLYLPKEIEHALGVLPGTIVKLTVQKGAVRLEPVSMVEVGDHSPEAVESYIRAAARMLPENTKLELAGEFLRERGE